MFFPERIKNVKVGDKVLEIGPGGSPHPRADVLLERTFSDVDAKKQRGNTRALRTDKQIIFYDGGVFPFRDGEFDYVICSHVIEHVENIDEFCSEIFRVGRSGYFEFPTPFYEYLYNFEVHKQFVFHSDSVLRFLPKQRSSLAEFSRIQMMFHRTLELGYTDLVEDMKELMFQGFEWVEPFSVQCVNSIEHLRLPELFPMQRKSRLARLLGKVLRWVP
jgi:SAM-dependent methyltransferase